jgi:hypothetical protein
VQVQAVVGSLRSDPLTVTFQPASPEGARRHQP